MRSQILPRNVTFIFSFLYYMTVSFHVSRTTPGGLQGAPHTYLQDNADGSVKITGIYGDLWDALRELFNFT